MLVSVLALGGIFRLILYIVDVEYNNYCNFAKFAFPQTFTQSQIILYGLHLIFDQFAKF